MVLILTKLADIPRKPGKDLLLAQMIWHKYPGAAEQMRLRAERYNAGVRLARSYEVEGKVLILSPDDITGADTLKCNRSALERLYQKRIRDEKRLSTWLNQQ